VGGPHAPYFQSARQARYQQAARRLIDAGFAYFDCATAEESAAERAAAERDKRPYVSSRRWMARTPEERAAFEAQGRTAVVRLAMPREGSLVVHDLIRGDVRFEWAQEQDHVIQRADGTCLYHLASVVDDHDFAISHVIRAEEHLSNTPRQVFIAQGLGYPLPAYAHVPYVAEPGSKQKLSKRKLEKYLKNPDFARVHEHGTAIAAALGLETSAETFNPVIVDFYEKVGFLPDAILNALLLLGWSLDDKTELFTREQMVELFSLERVKKGPASFDASRLMAFQTQYMMALSVEERAARARPFLERAGLFPAAPSAQEQAKLAKVVAALGDRLKVAGDVLEYGDFFFRDEVRYDAAAFDKRVRKPGATELLARFRARLQDAEEFTAPGLERVMERFLADEGVAIGEVVHAVRVAVTGKPVGPGVYDCLAILGREPSLRRIDDALRLARAER
jgi:glutamyl-tRNA synthetase